MLDRLEADLAALKNQYDLFFQGGRRGEPSKERKELEFRLLALSRRSLVNSSDQLRFSNLQGKYWSFVNLWARIVRDFEEGRLRRDKTGALTRVRDRECFRRRNGRRDRGGAGAEGDRGSLPLRTVRGRAAGPRREGAAGGPQELRAVGGPVGAGRPAGQPGVPREGDLRFRRREESGIPRKRRGRQAEDKSPAELTPPIRRPRSG